MNKKGQEEIVIILFGTIVIIGAVVLLFISSHLNAYASEDANKECIDKGYDTYDSYKRPFMSKDAMGVKCKMIDYSRKQIDVNVKESTPIIVST